MRRAILAAFAFLTIFSVAFWGCCKEDDEEDDNQNENTGWQIIETIVCATDTENVIFDNVSDKWDMLQINAYGKLIGVRTGTYAHDDTTCWMYMTINDDNSANYSWYANGSWREHDDNISLGYWTDMPCNINISIYPHGTSAGEQTLIWESSINDSLSDQPWLVEGSASHMDTLNEYVQAIDIYNNQSSQMRIATGSTFILLGLDKDN